MRAAPRAQEGGAVRHAHHHPSTPRRPNSTPTVIPHRLRRLPEPSHLQRQTPRRRRRPRDPTIHTRRPRPRTALAPRPLIPAPLPLPTPTPTPAPTTHTPTLNRPPRAQLRKYIRIPPRIIILILIPVLQRRAPAPLRRNDNLLRRIVQLARARFLPPAYGEVHPEADEGEGDEGADCYACYRACVVCETIMIIIIDLK